jgi:hypothetical protein
MTDLFSCREVHGWKAYIIQHENQTKDVGIAPCAYQQSTEHECSEYIYRLFIPEQFQGDQAFTGYHAGFFCSQRCALAVLDALDYDMYTSSPHEVIGYGENEGLPSQIEKKEREWLYAWFPRPSYPAETPRSGKWLVFLRRAMIDTYWQRIKQALRNQQLGDGAKVSTREEHKEWHTIGVYTYDYADEADVMRVREVLRTLGVRFPIRYKANSDTYAKRYGNEYIPKYRA